MYKTEMETYNYLLTFCSAGDLSWDLVDVNQAFYTELHPQPYSLPSSST